ncbi:hypothetical protein BASA81_009821 [Batrachochytrium salamandrivorans]|nr:hypothetical protein BASA81_009821 [Batrachochytrium salamandrivorans]
MLSVWRRTRARRRRHGFSSLAAPIDPIALRFNQELIACTQSGLLSELILGATPAQLTPVNLATAIHRMGKLASPSPLALTKVLNLANNSASQFQPQAISNMCYGIAKSRLCNGIPKFLQTQAVLVAKRFSPKETANLLHSLAVQKEPAPEVFQEFAKQIDRQLPRYSPRDLSISLWSFAMLGHGFSPQLFSKCASTAVTTTSKLAKFNSHDIALFLFSFATLGHPCPSKVCSAAANAFRVSDGDAHSLLLFVWSLACLDALGLHKVSEFFVHTRLPPHVQLAKTPTQANQVHFARLAWDQTNPGVRSRLLEDLEFGNWVSNARQSKTNSGYQSRLEISAELKLLFPHGQVNASLPALDLQVDFYLPDKNFAIEIEGRHNYASDGITPLGSTQFKHRLLTRSGMGLCKIHVDEYSQYSAHERRDLLLTIQHHLQQPAT